MGIRADCINVYYRGGNLLRVHRRPPPQTDPTCSRYEASFHPNYGVGRELPNLPPVLTRSEDVQTWLDAFPVLKDAMDRSDRLGVEREIQQSILRDNNFCSSANSTDYYVCDIEYSRSRADAFRFDIVGVHWPSEPNVRKRGDGRRLFFAEVKQGDKALGGKSGLHSHIRHVNAHLADTQNVTAIKAEMIEVFNQKRKLGLLEPGRELVSFSDEPPLLILVLVNHDPQSLPLGKMLRDLPEHPNVDLRVATSSLMGYGLYEHCVMTVEAALERFGDLIQ